MFDKKKNYNPRSNPTLWARREGRRLQKVLEKHINMEDLERWEQDCTFSTWQHVFIELFKKKKLSRQEKLSETIKRDGSILQRTWFCLLKKFKFSFNVLFCI
jgi:hypothetical protein